MAADTKPAPGHDSSAMKFYPVIPMAKPRPRVTRNGIFVGERGKSGDKWAAFKAECAVRRVLIPSPAPILIFDMPVPSSLRKSQRAARLGRPHQQTPDTDNLVKGILDAVLENDAVVYANLAIKRWVSETNGGIWIGDARNAKDFAEFHKILKALG